MKSFRKYYQSPIGIIKITSDDDALISSKYLNCNITSEANFSGNKISTGAISQLDEYLKHKRKIFDVPIRLDGSDFQKKV